MWPVRPHDQQHPIRGSFLDPRPERVHGATFHNGVDVAVRDDRPEPGAPHARTHRVYAIEGGRVEAREPAGRARARRRRSLPLRARRRTRAAGRARRAGPADRVDVRGKRGTCTSASALVGPDGAVAGSTRLRRDGKLHPYVDRADPRIHEIRYYTPASPHWGLRRRGNVARLPPAGRRLDKDRLAGTVDVRVHADDPQSFIGWFADLPWLAAPHHPFRLAVDGRCSCGSGEVVDGESVFRAERYPSVPVGQHFAPGTDQNLPANGCLRLHRTVRCDGMYWFRLFPEPYWDTTRFAERPLPVACPRVGHRRQRRQAGCRSDDRELTVRAARRARAR